MRKFYFLGSLFFALNLPAFNVPALQGPVMDQVGVLSTSAAEQLSQNLFQFKAKTGAQIQIFVTPTLNDEPIENVAIQIFDQWKLGNKQKDNGILFLIAPNQRKMRIEVGQGLEGSVPDVIAKRIIDDVVRPYFKQNDFESGIFQGVAALEKYIATGEEPSPEATSSSRKLPGNSLWIIIILFLVISSLFSGRGGRGGGSGFLLGAVLGSMGRGGGGSWSGGGGGWGGGGGSSSGGGSSGSW